MTRCALLCLLAIVLLSWPAHAATVRVDWSGGGDYLTIQEGINAAGEGDTVLVAFGVYSGTGNRHLALGGVNRVIRGESATIDCEGADCAFYLLNSHEDSTTVIEGFTITGGAQSTGGGVTATHAAPNIRNCRFEYNTASNGAAIAYTQPDSPFVVSDCIFHDNTATYKGGGIFLSGTNAEAVIRNCLFYDNTASNLAAGGLLLRTVSPTTVTGCTFAQNTTGGATTGAIQNEGEPLGVVTLTRTVIAYNTGTPTSGDGFLTDHCIVFENTGGDTLSGTHVSNLFRDPLFCDPDANDFEVCADSPCLPGFNIWGEQVGATDSGCPPCDTPVESFSWGRLKALYR